MQIGKPHLRRLSEQETKILEELALEHSLNLADIASNPIALQVPKAKYIDVFDVPRELVEMLEQLESHYASDMYLGYIEDYKFKPSLPLARKPSKLCSEKLCSTTLDWGGGKKIPLRKNSKRR